MPRRRTNSWAGSYGLSVGSVPTNALVVIELGRFNSGDVKGTIRSAAVRLPFTSSDVRRQRLNSISNISLLPCHPCVRPLRYCPLAGNPWAVVISYLASSERRALG